MNKVVAVFVEALIDGERKHTTQYAVAPADLDLENSENAMILASYALHNTGAPEDTTRVVFVSLNEVYYHELESMLPYARHREEVR